MLSMLLNKYPELMNIIKNQLIKYVRYCERKYNATAGTYWYRFIRPDDPGVGAIARAYSNTYSNGAEEHLFVTSGAALTVPAANAYVVFGWYVDFDGGNGGYLRIQKQNVTKQELLMRKPYESKNPKHLYLDFDSVVFAQQQELLGCIARNSFGVDQIGFCFPFMFRIASKSALNLE